MGAQPIGCAARMNEGRPTMGEQQMVYEWTDGNFSYRAIDGYGVARGGTASGVTAWSGHYVCTDSAVVRELARLAAERDRLREALRRLYDADWDSDEWNEAYDELMTMGRCQRGGWTPP